tara:strand:- start:679 stop:1725 length:1047 start_codon:yes stop_codon:yes gene_type:complete
MSSSLKELKEYFATTPAELQGVVRCPMFDDFDDSDLSPRHKEVCDDQRQRFLQMMKGAETDKYLFQNFIDMHRHMMRSIIETRPMYENTYGAIIPNTSRGLPVITPVLEMRSIKDEHQDGLHALGGVGMDHQDEHESLMIGFMFSYDCLVALSGYGLEATIMTHEAVHLWEDVQLYHQGGVRAISDRVKDLKTGRAVYKKAREEWEEKHRNDPQYYNVLTELPTYRAFVETKRLYSTLNPSEDIVTRVFADNHKLTYDEALEVAHAPFMDIMVQLVTDDIKIDPIRLAKHMHRSVLPFVTPRVKPLFKEVIKCLRDHSLMSDKQSILETYYKVIKRWAEEAKRETALA